MRYFFTIILSTLSIQLSALVYDVFPFFNEFDILEIRLNELKDVVDYFVIIESAETFSGKPKPFHLENYKSRYPKFAKKIIYHKNEGRVQNPYDGYFEREWFQRNRATIFCQRVLKLKVNDIVIVSDADEIPRAQTLKKAIDLVKSKKRSMVGLDLTEYRYFLNRKLIKKKKSPLPVVTNYKTFSLYTYMGIRRHRCFTYYLDNGGWHFSSITDNDGFFEKYTSLYRKTENKKNTTMLRNKLLRDRTKLVPIDGSYPKYIRDNIEKYRSKGYLE